MQLIFLVLSFFIQAHGSRQPRLEDYLVGTTYKGNPAPLNLHGDEHCSVFGDCSKFRGKIEKELRKGPNFADHYRIVIWSETACLWFGIFDLVSGYAHFPDQGVLHGLVFRRDSKLLIIDPPDSTYFNFGPEISNEAASFLLWQNDTLKQIFSTHKALEFEYKLYNSPIN